MGISIRGTPTAWAAVSGVTSQTVTLPTHVAGDMLIVRAAAKPTAVAAPSTLTLTCSTEGWNPVGTQYNNGTTNSGNGVGSMAHRAFYKIATSSSETNPVVSYGNSVSPGMATAVVYQCASDEMFIAATGAGGGDATLRTSQTCTISSHISVIAGDMVDFFLAWSDNYASTNPTITQTGVTYDTVSEQPATALSSATGNDGAMDGGYRLASSGTSSAAAVVTATFGNSEQGGAWQTRLRVEKKVTLGLVDGGATVYGITVTPDQLVTLGLVGAGPTVYAITVSDASPPQTVTLGFVQTGSPVQTYAELILSRSPLAFWRLGEPSGTNLNDEANANDMTLASGTLGSTGLLSGDSDTCLDLNGTSNYASRSIDSGLNVGDNFTIEAWVNLDALTDGSVIYNHGVGSASPSLELRGTGAFSLWVGGYEVIYSANSLLTTGTTYHIVATKNGTTRALYVNGVAVSSTLGTNQTADNSQTGVRSIGSYGGSSQFLNGRIDEVAIYPTALTYDEVVANYGKGSGFVTKSWAFTSDYEGWAKLSGNGYIGWYASGGDPDGYVYVVHDTYAHGDGETYLGLTTTWEDLGVPAGATVTRVRLRKVSRGLDVTGVESGGGGALYILDESSALLGTILAATFASEFTWTKKPIGSWVDITNQASSDQMTIRTSASATYEGGDTQANVKIDTLYLDIEYTGGSGETTPIAYGLTLSHTYALVLGLVDGGATVYSLTVTAEAGQVTLGFVDGGATVYGITLAPDQLVTLGHVDGSRAVYGLTLGVDQLVTLGLVDSGATVYGLTLSHVRTTTLGLVDGGATVYGLTLSHVYPLTLGHVDGGATVYGLGLYPDQLVTLAHVDGARAAYSLTLSHVYGLTLGFVDGGATVYGLTVTPDQLVTLAHVNGGAAVYGVIVSDAGGTPQDVTLGFVDGGATVYGLTVTPITDVSLGFVDGAATVYGLTLSHVYPLVLGLVDAGNAVYSITLAHVRDLTLDHVDAGRAIYGLTLSHVYPLTLPHVDGGATPYGLTLAHAYNLTLPHVDGGATVYSLTVVALGSPQDVTLDLVDGVRAVYTLGVYADQLVTLGLVDAGRAVHGLTLEHVFPLVLDLVDGTATVYAITVTQVAGDTNLVLSLVDGGNAVYSITVTNVLATISGYTRNQYGAIIPNCTVDLFRSSDNAYIGSTTSNALGHYVIGGAPGVEHFLVAYSAAKVYGVTARDIVGA